ncbi:hypothetical protein PV325_006034 [Microctonus aethiopoides]|nr:hypothetical protein PV325_006034 [Microctonus aethiopoides]KAK0082992.1 hypothetical protein PV326_006917 [Microctonus aethiopoides]
MGGGYWTGECTPQCCRDACLVLPEGMNDKDSISMRERMAKLDKSHNGKPSRVIHIRNIASDVSQSEIIHLGLPFGRVTNVLVLKGKNQGWIKIMYRFPLFTASSEMKRFSSRKLRAH